MNMVYDIGGNESDDLDDSEEDYIPSDDDGEIDSLLSDNITSDEDGHRDENMFELDPSTNDIRTNFFLSRNKYITWENEPPETTKGRLCSHYVLQKKVE